MHIKLEGEDILAYIYGYYTAGRSSVFRWMVEWLLPRIGNGQREMVLDYCKKIFAGIDDEGYQSFLRVYEIPIAYREDGPVELVIGVEQIKMLIEGKLTFDRNETWRWCIDYLYDRIKVRSRKIMYVWMKSAFPDRSLLYNKCLDRYNPDSQYVASVRVNGVRRAERVYLFVNQYFINSSTALEGEDVKVISMKKL